MRLPAILTWFAFFFGLTSTVLTFVAASRAHREYHGGAYPDAVEAPEMGEREKKVVEEEDKEDASVEQREIV